jgi:2-oxoglutarate ferredoxin oxidoreductase subunit alpha
MDRGKVLTAEDLERIGEFARYRDVDGDGITYRTLPGTEHPLSAWFARGTGHDEKAAYSEDPEAWTRNMARLARKHETARQFMPKPIIERAGKKAQVGLIAFGSTDPAVREARDRLADQGLVTDYLRLRAVPFTEEVAAFIEEHERVYVVEMNADGQMRQLLQLEVPASAARIRSLRHNDGFPITAAWVVQSILEMEEGENG